MINRYVSSVLCGVCLIASLAGCNDNGSSSSDSSYVSEVSTSSTAITAFNIKANTKVMANLDSVYFTINLEDATIFNADSLPFGTDVTKLLPVITVDDGQKVEIVVRGSKVMKDTTLTYSSSMTDSIDFTAQSVKARVISVDEKNKREYAIKVNVHMVKSDTLVWGSLAWRQLPGKPVAQRTVVKDNKIYTFLTDSDGQTSLSIADNPEQPMRAADPVDLPSKAVLRTITPTSDAFYLLDEKGEVYTSDLGYVWRSLGVKWAHIYGGYDDVLLGVEKIDNGYYFATIPDRNCPLKEVPDDCPVAATGNLLYFAPSKWGDTAQVMFTGGRTASGSLTGSTWSFDGSFATMNWTKVSMTPIDRNFERMSFVPYYTYRQGANPMKQTKIFTLLAMGGISSGDIYSNYVYASPNMGITWKRGDTSLQFPSWFPEFYDADVIVWDSTLTSRSDANRDWNYTPLRTLPVGASRAVAPVNEWECPYIYIYGGRDSHGSTMATVWRGVINRLTYQPLI